MGDWRATIVGPNEVLVIVVPAEWQPRKLRELNDALAVQGHELGIQVVAVPGTGMAVAQMPPDPFSESPV
jgi:hypothetical protein